MSATLDGRQAVRLVLDGGSPPIEDFIVLSHDGLLFLFTIAYPEIRDEHFVAEALKGFRFRSPDRADGR